MNAEAETSRVENTTYSMERDGAERDGAEEQKEVRSPLRSCTVEVASPSRDRAHTSARAVSRRAEPYSTDALLIRKEKRRSRGQEKTGEERTGQGKLTLITSPSLERLIIFEIHLNARLHSIPLITHRHRYLSPSYRYGRPANAAAAAESLARARPLNWIERRVASPYELRTVE